MADHLPRRMVRLEDLRPVAEEPLERPGKGRRRPRDADKQAAVAVIQEARLHAMTPSSWIDPRTGRRVLRLPYYL